MATANVLTGFSLAVTYGKPVVKHGHPVSRNTVLCINPGQAIPPCDDTIGHLPYMKALELSFLLQKTNPERAHQIVAATKE